MGITGGDEERNLVEEGFLLLTHLSYGDHGAGNRWFSHWTQTQGEGGI